VIPFKSGLTLRGYRIKLKIRILRFKNFFKVLKRVYFPRRFLRD